MAKLKTVTRNACEVLVINGHICHETGCPEAYKDVTRECAWCGSDFQPEERYQKFCCEDCAISYNS